MADPSSPSFTLIPNVADLIESIPTDGIVSRTFFKGGRVSAIVFGFAAGQELSEHTASKPVVIQIVRGAASVTVADERLELQDGAWLYLTPHVKHSVHAQTPLVMLLTMLGKE